MAPAAIALIHELRGDDGARADWLAVFVATAQRVCRDNPIAASLTARAALCWPLIGPRLTR